MMEDLAAPDNRNHTAFFQCFRRNSSSLRRNRKSICNHFSSLESGLRLSLFGKPLMVSSLKLGSPSGYLDGSHNTVIRMALHGCGYESVSSTDMEPIDFEGATCINSFRWWGLDMGLVWVSRICRMPLLCTAYLISLVQSPTRY